ncbi:beta-propeller fold lactonase family protein [Hymenobacter sp. BT523]|uniref:LVIVD repeat-containing protein n=1 Tax=Hymenobacter sp. BT523 TaxID=2795725 RepID=UPI0018EC9632|nr:beta-propeller fold lactonase family protein [Hymenobacter sp. BT523]MBJ6110799.1 beta-propeller fold lactonase family protein [Hymenobacter sp. BT523]
MKNLSFLLGAALALAIPTAALAQNVGVGTTAPTQKLDVNGNLRVRGLSGEGARLPQVLPDGTLGLLDNADSSPTGTAPNQLGSAATGQGPVAVAVNGATAYVVNNGNNTLQTFDVSNPANPVLLNGTSPGAGGGGLNGGTAGTLIGAGPSGVAVRGTTAYVVDADDDILQVFNVGNPAQPTLLNGAARDAGTRTGSSPSAVAVSGTLVYVVNNGSNTLQLFDVSNPASPTLVNNASPMGTRTDSRPAALAVSGSTVYVVNNGSNTLQLFDVSNPAAPRLLNPATAGGTTGGTATGNTPRGVAVSGSTVYVVNDGGRTLQAFDVSNPAAPRLLNPATAGGTTGGTATGNRPAGIALNGSRAYVVNSFSSTLQAFDVSNPAVPFLLNPTTAGGTTGGTATGQEPRAVAVSGTTAYVVNYAANTLQPFRINSLRALGLLADGSLAVADDIITLPGDNLGSHTATRPLNLNGFALTSSSGPVTLTADLSLGSRLLRGTSAVNLGSNLNLGTNQLVGNGGSQGLSIDNAGNAGLGTGTPNAKLDVNGYLRVAGASDAPAAGTVPSVAFLKLTATMPTTAGTQIVLDHGLTVSKILGLQVLVDCGNGNHSPPSFTDNAGELYYAYLNNGRVVLRAGAGSTSTSVLGKTARILITYEQ